MQGVVQFWDEGEIFSGWSTLVDYQDAGVSRGEG